MADKKSNSKLVDYEEKAKLFRWLSMLIPFGIILLSSGRAPLFLIFTLVAVSLWKSEHRAKPWFLLFIYEVVAIIVLIIMTINSK